MPLACVAALCGWLVLHAAAAAPIAVVPVAGEAAAYWTRWRGPSGQGLASGAAYVDTWSDTTNVKWRAAGS